MGNCQNFKSKDDPIHPTQQNKSMLSIQLSLFYSHFPPL